MIKHYNITVKGRVQGVGFRYHTKMKASKLGIKGFVKNKLNRSVYIEAEGEEDFISVFLNWCKKGPDRAYVDSFQYTESPINNFSTFEIKY